MGWVATRYAARSIGRNARRSALSVVGIAIGCVLALYMESMNRGRDELFARMGAYSGAGHVRIVPARWPERRDQRLRLADLQGDLDAVRALPGVAVVAVRARAQVLLAMGVRVVPVEMVGVDPDAEPATFRFVQHVASGRYLRRDDRGTAVVGRALADRLRAGLDDEILATTVGAGGAIESAMFRIVGIVASGSEDIDASICQVVRGDLEQFTRIAGAGEVTIILQNWREADQFRSTLAARMISGDRALTWGDISPDFKGHMAQDAASSRFVSAIILLIVVLGVASAQLAAVLERRREFAVLAALGMGGGATVRLVLQEALALGLAGGALGLAVGMPLVWRLARVGLDFSRWMGTTYAFQGVIIEPIIYGDFGMWMVGYVFVVAVGATVAASLYPAWFAARTDPAVALRVAQ